jgi:hypothetical protein
MLEFRLYKSPKKVATMMLGSSAFVVLGIYLLTKPTTEPWKAWVCIGFFSLGILAGLYQILDRRPRIIINELGLFDRTTHHEFINWELIQDVYLAEMQRQQFICLVVDAAFEPSRKQGRFKRELAGLNKGMGFQELTIWLGSVDIDAQRFAEFILAMRGAVPPERDALVQKAIANL